MTTRTAFLAIQCTANTGDVGTYLYSGDHPRTGELVSPVMPGLVELFAWVDANGWTREPYDAAHPCGVYSKAPAMVPQQAQQQQACAAAFAEQLDVPPVCVEPNRLNRQDCEALAPGRRVQHRRHNWAGNTWRRLTIVEASAVRATHDITGTAENGPGIARELVCAATTHDKAGRVLTRETIRFQVYAS